VQSKYNSAGSTSVQNKKAIGRGERAKAEREDCTCEDHPECVAERKRESELSRMWSRWR
jgi:uncharacterized protein YjcR